MNHRTRFHPDLGQSRLETRALLAGTPAILPFLVDGSSFGPYFNVWASSTLSLPVGSTNAMSGAAPSLLPSSSSGTMVLSATGNLIPLAGRITPVPPTTATAIAMSIPVGSGANRAGAGVVGYGSSFASGYNFGLNATNAYGSTMNALGASLPLGSTGLAIGGRSGTPRNARSGERQESERYRFQEPTAPVQETQPSEPSPGANGDRFDRGIPVRDRLRVAPDDSSGER